MNPNHPTLLRGYGTAKPFGEPNCPIRLNECNCLNYLSGGEVKVSIHVHVKVNVIVGRGGGGGARRAL